MKLQQWISAAIRAALAAVCIATGCWCADAQEIKVRSFSIQMEPMTMPMQRKDINGNICALVKVIIPSAQAAFEGNLIGNCDFRTSEYWCYLSPGSKYLKVKYPACEPLMIDFTSLLGSGLKSRTIYELRLDVPAPAQLSTEFTITGTINVEEAGFGIGRGKTDREKFLQGLNMYLNMDDGRYVNVVNFAGDPFKTSALGYFDDKVQYRIPGVHVGDSLTVTSADGRYSPATIVITQDRLGGTPFDIQLKKKHVTFTGRLVDKDSGEPLSDVDVSIWRDQCHTRTDSCGRFHFDDLIIDHSYKLWCDDEPIGYNIVGETPTVIPLRDQNFEWRLQRSKVHAYIEFSPTKDTLSDFSAYCDEGHPATIEQAQPSLTNLIVSHPYHKKNQALILKRKGHKTIRIDDCLFNAYHPLKFEKGAETDTIHYRAYHTGSGINTKYKLRRIKK